MRRVTALYFDFNSPSVISSLVLTSPSIVIFHASGLFVSSGNCPLLRMKNFSIGVVSSSSRLSGVSATSGLSPSRTSLSFLPGEFQVLRSLWRGGGGGLRMGLREPGSIARQRQDVADDGAHGSERGTAQKSTSARVESSSGLLRHGFLPCTNPADYVRLALQVFAGFPMGGKARACRRRCRRPWVSTVARRAQVRAPGRTWPATTCSQHG
jgi:hypothetical protein